MWLLFWKVQLFLNFSLQGKNLIHLRIAFRTWTDPPYWGVSRYYCIISKMKFFFIPIVRLIAIYIPYGPSFEFKSFFCFKTVWPSSWFAIEATSWWLDHRDSSFKRSDFEMEQALSSAKGQASFWALFCEVLDESQTSSRGLEFFFWSDFLNRWIHLV